MERAKRYQVIVANDTGYCVLEEGTKEFCDDMLKWYEAHAEFFNGLLQIIERI